MRLTYADTNVLIAAVRGEEEIAERAMAILDDPDRRFVGSIFLELELVPKAAYNKQAAELEFYETYFRACVKRVGGSKSLLKQALGEATTNGLGAMDALHIVSAASAGAAELVTAESTTKPLHRTRRLPVISIAL